MTDNRTNELTIIEVLAKTHNGEGYLVIRNPVSRGQKAIEFFEVK